MNALSVLVFPFACPMGGRVVCIPSYSCIKKRYLDNRFATREQARRVVFEYIEVFYNRIRRHAKIGNNSPAEYANSFYAKTFKDAA